MKKSSLLERYRYLVPETLLTDIYGYAQKLRNLHVLHFNTTKKGGGVAGLLAALLPIVEDLGIRQSWEIVSLPEEALHFTTKLLDMLQGGEDANPTEQEQEAYIRALRTAVEPFQNAHADIYLVHDFQLIPFASLCSNLRPALWFCHIDTAHPHPDSLQHIRQFLDAYKLCMFNAPASVFPDLSPAHTHVITLGIDPFALKNSPLPKSEGLRTLAACGIHTERPLIAQVSRFGKWKNPWQVIDVYRLVKQAIPSVQVALVGALDAADDVDAIKVLQQVREHAHDDLDIHLLFDPLFIGPQQVNAFQCYADVVLQRSSREGFGLTVTEAMWKKRAVIGTSATGLKLQIIHNQNGFIADDTRICADYVVQLLQEPDLASNLGKHAQRHIARHYLLPMMLHDYLKALSRVSA